MKLPTVAFVIAFAAGEENPYDHPGPRLLERLRQAGVHTLRKEVNAAIHILTDGNGLEVSCFVMCSEVVAQVNSPKVPPPQNQENAQQQQIA